VLTKYFPAEEVELLEKESRDIGGWVTIQWRGIRFRFILDKIAYVINVAAPSEPSRWYEAQKLLLIMGGATYVPGQIRMLTKIEELDELCGHLMKNVDALVSMLDATSLPETKRAFAEWQRQFIQPFLELSEKNRQKRQ
jgi:hypothetical protein